MSVKVKTIEISADQLKPGDLFSSAGPEYWDGFPNRLSIGEKLWIRTNTPAIFAEDHNKNLKTFRLEIVKDES